MPSPSQNEVLIRSECPFGSLGCDLDLRCGESPFNAVRRLPSRPSAGQRSKSRLCGRLLPLCYPLIGRWTTTASLRNRFCGTGRWATTDSLRKASCYCTDYH